MGECRVRLRDREAGFLGFKEDDGWTYKWPGCPERGSLVAADWIVSDRYSPIEY